MNVDVMIGVGTEIEAVVVVDVKPIEIVTEVEIAGMLLAMVAATDAAGEVAATEQAVTEHVVHVSTRLLPPLARLPHARGASSLCRSRTSRTPTRAGTTTGSAFRPRS